VGYLKSTFFPSDGLVGVILFELTQETVGSVQQQHFTILTFYQAMVKRSG